MHSHDPFVNWLASLCFPDQRPLRQLAIVNAADAPLLRHRLGDRHQVSLHAIEFQDTQKCALLWRYVHPSTYSIGVDDSIAALVLGIKQQPNLAVIINNTAELLTIMPEAFERTGFLIRPAHLDPNAFAAALESAAEMTFPSLPPSQRHRVLNSGTILPQTMMLWLESPELRPLILSSAPVQRLIHHLPPNMLHKLDGSPYQPQDWIIYKQGIYECLKFSEDHPHDFIELVNNAPFLIIAEDSENVCNICVQEAYSIAQRFQRFSINHNKAIIVMINPTPTSDEMCATKSNDLGALWCTFSLLRQSAETLTVAASAPAPSTTAGMVGNEARSFNNIVKAVRQPMLAAHRHAGEQALIASQNRSARYWPHELEALHASNVRYGANGLTFSHPLSTRPAV